MEDDVIDMKKSIMCLALLLLVCMGTGADDRDSDQLVIESRLFRGTNQASCDYPHEVIITSFSTSFFLPEALKDAELKGESAESLKNELNKVFQVKRIDHLISGTMLWDGKKASLNETISFDEFSYPIRFSPEILSRDRINLKIEMFRVENDDMAQREDKTEKLLDTEIIVHFNKPVILGFPMNGHTYFLSIYVTRRILGGLLKGKIIEVPSSTPIMMPPTPIYRFNPIYPIRCRDEQIEGTVILEVSADRRGYVNRVKVLKPVDPDLDQTALLALKQWRYEPMSRDEKPVPAVFAVSVDFKLRERSSIREEETEKVPNSELDRILKRCASYCEELENLAFRFTCKEHINEDIYWGPFKAKNTYTYDYYLQIKRDEIIESRILREENGKKRFDMNSELKTNAFFSEKSMFAAARFLSKSAQDFYDYELLKEDRVFGRDAYVVKAAPKGRTQDNPNYGKLWVDKEKFSILKIETKEESLRGYEELKDTLEERGIQPVLSTMHLYEIEKEGIRFPSRIDFLEGYKGLSRFSSRARTRSKTVVEFHNYRFFTFKRM